MSATLVPENPAHATQLGAAYVGESRPWLAFEQNREYIAGSVLRFLPKGLSVARKKQIYADVLDGIYVSIEEETGFQAHLLAV